MYYTRKANERADALSRKHKDVKEQGKAIEEYRTQVLFPRTKIDSAVVQDLQLAPMEPIQESEPEPMQELELELTTDLTSQPYDSIQLLDKILIANRTSPDLAELRIKAVFEQEKTWQLKDGLLL
jgi:hypothetical protein